MANKTKFLLVSYIFVLTHTIKDFFQDFLETDFLYFADANENLMGLPQWGRWGLVVANQTVGAMVWFLVIATPVVLVRNKPRLKKVLIAGYAVFFLVVAVDLLLDPRIKDPRLFFDKSTRISASQMKEAYREILRQGPL